MGAPTEQGHDIETETYREWRLTGQPDGGFPFYDCTFSDRDRVEALFHIWSKIQTGEYPWKNAKLETREVSITRTAWREDPSPPAREA